MFCRYDRVRKAQLMGEETRNKWHSKAEKSEKEVQLPFPEWLLNFDAEREAYKGFDEVLRKLENQGYTQPNVELLYEN